MSFIFITWAVLSEKVSSSMRKMHIQIHLTHAQSNPSFAFHWYILQCPMILLATAKALIRLRYPQMPEDTFLNGAAHLIFLLTTLAFFVA